MLEHKRSHLYQPEFLLFQEIDLTELERIAFGGGSILHQIFSVEDDPVTPH